MPDEISLMQKQNSLSSFQNLTFICALLSVALLLSSCIHPYKASIRKISEIRVGVIIDHQEVYLRFKTPFLLRDANGKTIGKNIPAANFIVRVDNSETGIPDRHLSGNSLILQNTNSGHLQRLESGFEIISKKIFLGQEQEDTSFKKSDKHIYNGKMKFIQSANQTITVVNVLPLENYLTGVVPAEMSATFPLEALKAQAITARSVALYNVVHKNPSAIYDICGSVRCQVYSGVNKRSAATDRAVRETRGIILKARGKLVQTPYSSVCGGHTTNNEDVWIGQPQSHLRGLLDRHGIRKLTNDTFAREMAVRKWLNSEPSVYCNVTDTDKIPGSIRYTRKYFRWQVKYSYTELTKVLKKKTGKNFGQLVSLTAIARGASGRITRLRITGTQKTFELTGDIVIRRALAWQALWSSFFVIERTANKNFTITGAGYGHGVGMCQTGAGMMALQGNSHKQILQHYYTGVQLQKIY